MVSVLSLLAPFFLAASFEPFGLWFCAPIAYSVYLFFIANGKRPILYSLYFGLTSHLIILVWSGEFVGVVPWVLLAILQSLYLIPVGLLTRYTTHLPYLIVALLIMDEIKARFPFGGFAWTRIAFTQVDSPLASLVSLGGVAALSFGTLLLSLLFITRGRVLALFLLALAIVPSFLLPTLNADESSSLKFVAVQGGTPEKGLNFNARAMGVLNMHLSESYRAVTGDEDLLIWPENAIDIDPLQNALVRKKILELVTDKKIPLLAGAVLQDGPINAAILFKEDGEIGSMYFKRYLTPFGEYIPLRNLSEMISPFAKRVDDFEAGTIEKVHRVKDVKISSIICFEIINDGIVREAAERSEVIVVHTNSATFAGTSEGAQQLAITRLRALEHNRSIISISTTGPSAIISPRGVVLSTLEDGEISALSAKVIPQEERTPSDRFGGVSPLLVILSALLWGIRTSRLRERKGLTII